MRTAWTLAGLAVLLTACTENTATGNDREADREPSPTAAPLQDASSALENVATAIVKPETMSDADIAALGGKSDRCVFLMTKVAFPSFLYEQGARGAIKLNGKLISLSSVGDHRFADGELIVELRPPEEPEGAAAQEMEMVIVPPGADDEIGYQGYRRCYAETNG